MIFITGATGFLGKNLIPPLIKEGFNLNCLTRNPDCLKNLPVKITFGDLENFQWPANSGKIDTVIHMAAVINAKNPRDFYKINCDGTKKLIDECLKNEVKHFIFLSSLNVLQKNPDDYAQSKKMAEDYLQISGLNYTILRPSLIYGPNDTKNIGQLIKIAKKLPIVPIIGSGKNKIQPVYVNDIVNVVIIILKNPEKFYNKTYNLAGPDVLEFNELIDLILKTLSLKKKRVHVPLSLLRPFVFLYEKLSPNPKITFRQLKNSAGELTAPCDWPKDFGITPTTTTKGIGNIISQSQ